MKKNNNSLIICICFFAILIIFPVTTIVLPKSTFSETENKALQTMPSFSIKTLFDGSYTDKLETYISEHFAGRVTWISAKNKFEFVIGDREQNGIYILPDRMVEKITLTDYSAIDKSVEAINKFAIKNDTPVFLMLIPTSAEIYSNELPAYVPELNQKDLIKYVYEKLDTSITGIDAYSSMLSNKSKYIYYRTDHHWTTGGAFLAYMAAGKKMGYTPLDLSSYDIEHASTEFKGTFYSKTLNDTIEPDTVDIYHCLTGDKLKSVEITSEFGKEPKIYDSLYFREYLDVKDKYSVFTGTNQPLVTIKADNNGGKLLIIKDSYAHCFVPFLTQHYSEITMLDLRYIQMSYSSVIDISDYDQVLCLYNVSSFISDSNIKKLAYD